MKNSLLLFLLLPSFIMAQTENLIRNPGFEYKTNDASSTVPNYISQFEYVDYWKQDMSSSGYNHSPDFFSTTTQFLQIDYSTSAQVLPHSGNYYAGMSQAELIQQEFSEVAELIEGKKYTISFYIQPMKNGNPNANWSHVGAKMKQSHVRWA
jgi:hypothetical protein